jgi:hypothetical protein
VVPKFSRLEREKAQLSIAPLLTQPLNQKENVDCWAGVALGAADPRKSILEREQVIFKEKNKNVTEVSEKVSLEKSKSSPKKAVLGKREKV